MSYDLTPVDEVQQDDPNYVSTFRKFVGVCLIGMSAIIGGTVLLVSADVLAAFFSMWQTIMASTTQPSGAVTVENLVPTYAWIALVVCVISIVVSSIIAVLKIVLKKI